MHTSNTPIEKRITRLFNPAPGPVYIPNDLRDKLNETNGLWQLQVKPMDIQLFASCVDQLIELGCLDSTLLWMPEEFSEEYNAYRRQLGIVFNPAWMIQGYLNAQQTEWRGDVYALVQRQKSLA